MASIADDGGLYRILFVSPDGKRRAIRLGRVTKRKAESFRIRLESVIQGRATGHMEDVDAQWLAGLDARAHGKLVAAGLAAPRQAVGATTLKPFLDGYLAGRTDVKGSTQTCMGQARRRLVEFFGAEKPLGAITEGDAEEYARWLSGQVSTNTARRLAGRAKQSFRFAVRKKAILANPFADLKTNVGSNPERRFFVTRATADAVLAACPDAEWRLLLALSRFGGLRCPSEHVLLRWADVDWARGRILVHSPKTEHHEGGDTRSVPIFPELLPYLRDAFEAAEPGAEFAIARYRRGDQNMRTQLLKILARAHVTPWPKLFHNLRATRQTELEESFPTHMVCAWLGNSVAVARKHYLQVTDDHFEKAAQNPAQHPSEHTGTVRKVVGEPMPRTPDITSVSDGCRLVPAGANVSDGLYRT
jgi:integrase